jgi:hypothetical protein
MADRQAMFYQPCPDLHAISRPGIFQDVCVTLSTLLRGVAQCHQDSLSVAMQTLPTLLRC